MPSIIRPATEQVRLIEIAGFDQVIISNRKANEVPDGPKSWKLRIIKTPDEPIMVGVVVRKGVS